MKDNIENITNKILQKGKLNLLVFVFSIIEFIYYVYSLLLITNLFSDIFLNKNKK